MHSLQKKERILYRSANTDIEQKKKNTMTQVSFNLQMTHVQIHKNHHKKNNATVR